MKKILFLIVLILFCNQLFSQTEGSIIIDSIYSENLINDFGENPTREVAVYLPPDYSGSTKHYPVIYFLHGFMNDHQLIHQMKDQLDFAITTHRIRPFILVIPNE